MQTWSSLFNEEVDVDESFLVVTVKTRGTEQKNIVCWLTIEWQCVECLRTRVDEVVLILTVALYGEASNHSFCR